MPKRRVASGRKRQLKRLKRALLGHQRFDPTVFETGPWSAADSRGSAPEFSDSQINTRTEPTNPRVPSVAPSCPRKVEQLPAPSTSFIPSRLPTRPLPVSRQIKRLEEPSKLSQSSCNWSRAKPKIRSVRPMSLTIIREGQRILVGGNKVAPPPD